MPRAIRVVIADDHLVFRHGLRQVIEAQPDIAVADVLDDGTAALEAIRRLSPDVAVLDVRCPGSAGSRWPPRWSRTGCPPR